MMKKCYVLISGVIFVWIYGLNEYRGIFKKGEMDFELGFSYDNCKMIGNGNRMVIENLVFSGLNNEKVI